MVPPRTRTRAVLAVAALATSLVVAGCTATSDDVATEGGASTGTTSLVVDKAFDLKTADPGREYEPTGNIVAKALYETLLTFDGGDTSTVQPGLATLETSDDAMTFTLTLGEGHVFSDGTPMTAADVVFSLQRVIGMKGNPSFLLDGVTVTQQDDSTVVLTTATPTPALPAILANPALGIVNSAVVQENGGTTGEDDAAEDFLNTTSAGSGPYVLDTLDLSSQVVLTANPEYTGDAPGYDRITMRNVDAATQAINVQGGDSQVALDLSGDQAADLGDGVEVTSDPSANVLFLLLNQDPAVSTITSNPDFVSAVKKALDYDDLLEIAGAGTVQAEGVIPSMFLGALGEGEGLSQDLDGAAASLAASGYAGEPVTLNFPSDLSLNGVDFPTIAQRIQSQLSAAGITVELAPAPVATELDAYRNGTETIGMWYWGPDYPDPSDYLVFAPGDLVGLRAGWADGADADVEAAAAAAAAGGTDEERTAQFEAFQTSLNATGPFVPLVQPGNTIAAATSVTGVVYNPVWTIDLASLGSE